MPIHILLCRAANTLVLALFAGLLSNVAAADAFDSRLGEAIEAAAADPQRGLAAMRALREEALAQNRLDVRLAADEAECRVLTDADAGRAVEVADAGLAAAGPAPAGAARAPWLRLRACRAGMLVEQGDVVAGRAELEALLALTAGDADAEIRALARLERGIHRSRSGDLDSAQQDLLAACEVLRTAGARHHRDLCQLHLAGHYRRVGDAQESLRLLLPLRDAARQRGATFDASIYTYAIGQVHQLQERWADSLEDFQEAASLNERLQDRSGLAYAEHAVAVSNLRLERPAQALRHAERSLEYLNRAEDPRQFENGIVTRALALVALGRAAEANAALDSVADAVRRRGEQPTLADWLQARAQAMHELGRWKEAYLALAESREIRDRLQRQRLSEHSARLRMQYNRARDAEELSALRRLNEQGQRLRQTQALALALFVMLLAALLVVAVRKVRQARQLQQLASTDELTGLANRRALFAFAEQELARLRTREGRMALLMVDVDHFKRINDAHGHAVGDQVLRHVARLLTGSLRGRDRLGRVGGEEFIAVLPDTGVADAGQVAERMRAAIEASPLPRTPEGSAEVPFTVSIGVAGSERAEPAAVLVARADAALYRAKKAGRNCVALDDPAEQAAGSGR